MSVSVNEFGVAGSVWLTRPCVKPASNARSSTNPVWFVALLVQLRATLVADAGTAPSPDGAAGACGTFGE